MQRMPELKDRHLKYALDEWAVGGAGMERPLGAAEGLNEMFRHSGIIYLGNFTAATSTLAFNQTDATYSVIGLVFKMYRQHFGTIPVQVTGNSPQHEVKGTIGVDKPRVTSGSDTYPLDMVAALSADKKKLTVALVNPTETEQQIDLNFSGIQLTENVNCWAIIPPTFLSQNQAGRTPVVNITASQLTGVPKTFKAAPTSIYIYEFTIK
jgi:alpha-N-arabinofuranosidase